VITEVGAQITLNKLCGLEVPHIGTTPPAAWVPGMYWVNSSTSPPVVEGSTDGATWLPLSGLRYFALLPPAPAEPPRQRRRR
jgi:hypothetical protein